MKKIIICLFCLLTLAGCPKKEKEESKDLMNHEGEYVSSVGSLFFIGDGESIVFEFNDELKEALNITEVTNKGTYAFTKDHHGEIEYDKANLFRIFVKDIEISFSLSIGKTTFDHIVIVSPLGNGLEEIVFERKKS